MCAMLIKTEGVLNKKGPPSLLLNLVILLFYCENLRNKQPWERTEHTLDTISPTQTVQYLKVFHITMIVWNRFFPSFICFKTLLVFSGFELVQFKKSSTHAYGI